MMNIKRIYSVKDLEVGMRVEVANKYSSEILRGVVTKATKLTECRMIDGRPVSKSRNTSVKIEYNQGGEVILDDSKIKDFAIRQIG